jgi:cytoskeleton protein RodZ
MTDAASADEAPPAPPAEGAAPPAAAAADDSLPVAPPLSEAAGEPSKEPANEPLPADFGAQLRAAREAAGISVPTLAMRLRLHVKQVDALERCDLAALPALIYVRGFVRSVARELKIDPAPLLADLDRRAGVPAPTASSEASGSWRMIRFGDSSKPLIALVIGLLVVAGIVGMLLPRRPAKVAAAAPVAAAPAAEIPAPAGERMEAGGSEALPSMTESAPAPAASVPAPVAPPAAPAPRPETRAAAPRSAPPAVAAPAIAVPAPVVAPVVETPPPPPAAPAPAADALVLHVRATSWVEVVQANGSSVFSQICLAGSEHTIRGTPPLKVTIGNAAAVDAQFRGAAVDLASHANANGVARLTLP